MKVNKKAVSEMVSYVLLIVIAVSLSVGIYSWMKFYVPSNNVETCSEEAALTISSYYCDTGQKEIKLVFENKGKFRLNGFALRVSNNTQEQPIGSLEILDESIIKSGNLYYFKNISKSGDLRTIWFNYTNISEIQRIQVQPFVNATKGGAILLCDQITDINLEVCN